MYTLCHRNERVENKGGLGKLCGQDYSKYEFKRKCQFFFKELFLHVFLKLYNSGHKISMVFSTMIFRFPWRH